jgi:hypothetical protein
MSKAIGRKRGVAVDPCAMRQKPPHRAYACGLRFLFRPSGNKVHSRVNGVFLYAPFLVDLRYLTHCPAGLAVHVARPKTDA